MSNDTKNQLRFVLELLVLMLAIAAAVKGYVLLPPRVDKVESDVKEMQGRSSMDHDLLVELRTNMVNMQRDVTEIKQAVSARKP
jgi:hypothetical protein